MGIQIGLSLLLDEGAQLLLEEGLCFWTYIYFYLGYFALIHVLIVLKELFSGYLCMHVQWSSKEEIL